ncbi:choline-phosphate cytidylyltransferase A-like isoform X3 [Tribolium madens]|uniref:choline-phosphate cytidylyltransferase A-like isoform X3 n=1 Tax=Tribolium madens TaxID=41895 RepID=UPI001CF72DDB|nr:choline-phosphate cytidylyltransferase A-like isoform X3 [Tribolium madens]
MLDLHESATQNLIMSRKRTRSRSEDNVATNHVQNLTNAFCTAAPFSEDPEPTKIREECDYNIKITLEMAKSGNTPRPVRVYADGAFDLFHQGHAKVLMQAKQAFPNVYLIVGVSNDTMLRELKGRTVMTEDERYNAVRHCRYVDEVLRDAPWEYTDEFLENNKIDFVAHDDIPYESENTDDTYGELKKRGMFLATERTEGVSTSDIVARIVRDYDIYVRRNLARGYSAKDLNVGYIKEKTLKLQNKMDELKDKGKNLIDTIGERTDDIIMKWKDESREVIDSFLEYFFKRPMRIWKESKGKFLRALTPPGTPCSGTDDEDDSSPPRKIRRVF